MIDFVPFTSSNILRKTYNPSPVRVVRDLIYFLTPSAPLRVKNRNERD